jgi:hypothetical protein
MLDAFIETHIQDLFLGELPTTPCLIQSPFESRVGFTTAAFSRNLRSGRRIISGKNIVKIPSTKSSAILYRYMANDERIEESIHGTVGEDFFKPTESTEGHQPSSASLLKPYFDSIEILLRFWELIQRDIDAMQFDT